MEKELSGLTVPTEHLPSMPPDLSCLTPPPVPVDTPDDLRRHHRLLRSVGNYCIGRFDARVSVDDGNYVCELQECLTACYYPRFIDILRSVWSFAQMVIGDENHNLAQHTVALVKQLGVFEDAWFFFALIENINDLSLPDNTGFGSELSEYISSISLFMQHEYGQRHPLGVIASYLPDAIGNGLFSRAYECLVDSITEKTSPESYTRIWVMSGLSLNRAANSDFKGIAEQRRMALRYERSHGNGHYETFIARITPANCLHILQ